MFKRKYEKSKILLGIIMIATLLSLYNKNSIRMREKMLQEDFENHYLCFDNVIDVFQIGKAVKYSAKDYKGNDENLIFIFNELKYKEVFSDYKGNIFFNKFEEGINFKGNVFVKESSYVIGIPKSKYADLKNDNWEIYYMHGL